MLRDIEPAKRVELGEKLRNLSNDEKRAFMETLSEDEALELLYDPYISVRKDQFVTWDDDKPIVLLLAARGFGKTHTMSRVIKGAIEQGVKEITLCAPTHSDLVNTNLYGPSGIFSTYHEGDEDYPNYVVSKGVVEYPKSKARIRLISGENPERARGINSELLLVEEVGSLVNAEELISNLFFGLRLGKSRALFITSPRSTPFIIDLYNRKDADVKLMTGTSMANRENLSETFFKNAEAYKGSARYRQEVLGELILENDGALWSRELLDKSQISRDKVNPKDFMEVVVGVDPSGTATKSSDLFGIIVAAKTIHGEILILEDLTGRHPTNVWSSIIGGLYQKYSQICLTKLAIETNGAGAYVDEILKRDHGSMNIVPIKSTTNKRGRAETASFLYYQGIVKHVIESNLVELENEQSSWEGRSNERSPNRIDGLVFCLQVLSPTKRDSLKIRHFAF